ncbi:MAG: translocation/assembly module TamB domain-containing protein [Campylobacterota bacterium]|nr:translocation/assembly module TamB domain-containing protein [Campylobacterota bacterium]
MKKIFKWIGYLLLTLIVLVVATVLFLLNSTQTIQWAAEKYAPQYGFGYKQISGGLLSGLEVEELTFQDDKLLDRFKVGWNPAPLLHKKVSITHLEATGLDVENIKKVAAAFTSDEPKEESNTTFVLPVSVGLGELHVTVNPFEESGVKIRSVAVDGEDITYVSGDRIDIESLQLAVDTNLTQIELNAGSEDHKIKIIELSVLDIDALALLNIVQGHMAKEVGKEIKEESKGSQKRHKKGDNHLVPSEVQVERVNIVVKPAKIPQLSLEKGELNISSAHIDIHKIMEVKPDAIQVGEVTLDVETNLTRLVLDGSLEHETVMVKSLSVRDIDTLALTKIFVPVDANKTATAEPEAPEEPVAADTNAAPNPLIPKFLYVEHLDTSIKSATYEPVLVNSAEVNATNVKFDIVKLVAESGEIDINAVTSFATLIQHGVIDHNQIKSEGHVTPLKMLYETYNIPLKEDAFGNITLDINADKERAQIDIIVEGKEILQAKEGEFNVNHLHLANRITYSIPEAKLTVENEGNISTPYAKDIRLENLLTLEDGALNYKGEVDPGKLEEIDGNYTKPLNDLKITYHGDAKSIEALIDSEGLKGKFISPDFKKGDFTLSTKQPLVLKNMVSLPEPLQEAKAALNIHIPLDFAKITPLKATAKITSNIANIDADLLYDKEVKVLTKTIFPKDSLLRGFSKELNLDVLSPLHADVTLAEKAMHVDVKSKGLTSKVTFNPENKNLDGDLILGGAKFVFDGNIEKKVTLNNSVASLQSLLKKINTIYAFEPPPLDGDLKVSIVLTDMKDLELNLNSNQLIYKADRKTEYLINNTMISLGFVNSVLTLNKYHTTFQEQKIFATKPSVISLKEGNVEIAPLWINDELKVTGKYNIEKKKGEILAYADPFNVSHEMIDLASRVDIKTKLDGVKTAINGTVTIMGGNVYIDMDKKSFASDSDIIIVQDMKKEEPSPFMDNLTASIKVNTEKPLLYKTADADIKAKADLLVQKAPKGPIYVLGTAEILKGSSYTFEGKKFVLKKSIIAFTGDPNQPILDIAAIYNSLNYEITIQVTGSPETPNIIFSSIPSLSREEILSVILFDSEEGAGSNSGDDMMKMMGGAMAKSVLANAGIKIDHLSLGSDGSMEVGKKIADKVTIIYVNEEVQGARLQYDYSKNIKGYLSTDTDSSGADIVYKREFKKSELPFFRSKKK